MMRPLVVDCNLATLYPDSRMRCKLTMRLCKEKCNQFKSGKFKIFTLGKVEGEKKVTKKRKHAK